MLTGFSLNAQAETTAFFSSVQDIPLKPGLVELDDQALTFDKPGGRIIESIAQIKNGTNQEVLSYYEQALPQLGWTKKYDGSFVRNGERLKIDFENFDDKRFFRLMIEPR